MYNHLLLFFNTDFLMVTVQATKPYFGPVHYYASDMSHFVRRDRY